MEKLSHWLNYYLFNNFNIRITVIVFGSLGSLGSYYVYKKILHSFSSIGRNQLWKKIPFIQKKVENEIRKMKEKNNEDTESYNNKLVEKLLTSGVTNVDIGNINTIQESGLNKETLMTYLHTLKDMDSMPKLISGTIYDDHENQHKEIMQAAYNLYAYTNPMHIDLFHSVVFMEKNLIVMISKLLGNMEHQCGSITNGGTESIFLALKTYRDMKCMNNGFLKNVDANASVHKINVVAPDTVHCSVDKLCHYLNIQLIKVKSNHEHRVTVCDILNTINEYTACVVLSAPSYGFGIMDDVEHIAPAMKERGIPVHVDACLGGFVWMFQQQRENGIEMEMDVASKYSFRVDGVTSVSACFHKYGYSQKGVSCILYRDESYLKYQYFVTADWDGGLYVSPTILGSRSGGLVAQAWAGFLSRGYKEYQDSSNKIIHIAKYAHEKIQLVRECRAYPLDLHIVCFDIGKDTYKLYDYLITKGFNLNALQNPPAIHLCVTKMHDETTIDALVQEIETFIQCKDALEYKEDLAPIYGMKASIPVYTNEILNECISSYLINKYST
jgi:glutamate/tyrosine decarboxylase-like PLP-dependent enzyme